MAYSYVPAYSTGGPCSLGRLTLFLPQKPHQVRHHRELALDPSCDSDIHLFSPAEYIPLSLFVVPAMTIALNVEISHIACSMAKALNATSQAIHTMNQELGQVGEVVLENQAAKDYLLLKHNQGCEDFKGLCCFNLSDNSHLIEDKELSLAVAYGASVLVDHSVAGYNGLQSNKTLIWICSSTGDPQRDLWKALAVCLLLRPSSA
ncbi:hypothetical protein mRhiFer1_008081 [Rhinolophus ferrumequinum]|uniref:Uncharacterized protein n=1 Tax=Rhinolophus ferrumequinum TaxID=59479 RepID=A0A7J7WRB9_RHIFE|nr:hypothetical protein mRhiFer1_008081 [Rhinolophus ferrumequinum]